MNSSSIGTPGVHAGPYDGRCKDCHLYLCDCPVAMMGRLGYLWCIPCATGRVNLEPVTLHQLFDGTETCTECGVTLVPKHLSA